MVDQEELHHALAAVLHQRRPGPDMQSRRGVGEAGDDRLRRPVDLRPAGRRIRHRLLCAGIERRRAHLDQAHPAIARDGQLGVIAEMRNLDAQQPRRLDHVRAFRHGDVPAVDIDGNEVGVGRGDH